PNDYRRFLLEVGDGGAGPAWGLYGLERKSLALDAATISERFEHAFPHVVAWKTPAFPHMCDDDDQVVGTLPIDDFGCGIEFILILNGPERGNIWLDDRANCYGVAPVVMLDGKIYWPNDAPDGGTHVDFYTWYNTWLDEEIA